MKRWIRWFAASALICLFLGLYVSMRIDGLDEPIGDTESSITVDIARGMTFKQIVLRLEEVGAVKDPLVFEWYGRYVGLSSQVQPGRYTLDAQWTPKEILAAITTSKENNSIRVHIVAGWSKWHIADRLSKLGLVERETFLRRVESESLEGQLFPGNYTFKREINTNLVIDQMTNRFKSRWSSLMSEIPNRHGLSEDELLILSSIVQKESAVYEDQRKVSRVFYNRLKKGQKLQTDPTCVYGPEKYTRKPNPKDCRDQANLYSTYVIKGLPPGAIGNPGAQAIKATLLPFIGEGSERLFFFVARRDGSGEHYFSETYAEHRRADRRARKVKSSP